MKPFNLKEYLENPYRKVVTRDGRAVRIICTNGNIFSPVPDGTIYPVVALVKKSSNNRGKNPNEELLICYSTDGHVIVNVNGNDYNDLFFETVKVSGWINIYRSTGFPGGVSTGTICETKEEALSKGEGIDNYLDTIFIEWEE